MSNDAAAVDPLRRAELLELEAAEAEGTFAAESEALAAVDGPDGEVILRKF